MTAAEATSANILAEESREDREEILAMLERAYWMEIETVMSYIAASTNPDGVRAEQVKASLRADIAEELGHAHRFAARIKERYGVVPDQTDIVHVVRGVIEAERQAIDHYSRIIERTEHADPVTQDMVIEILHDEQGHLRLFEGFLREYEGPAAG